MVKRQDSKSARVRELLGAGVAPTAIAKQVGCTVGLVYNVKSRMGGTPKRGPGRPPKRASAGVSGLDSIIATMRSSAQERERLQATLKRISALIAEAL